MMMSKGIKTGVKVGIIAAIVGLFSLSYAFCDVTIFKSPVVWRTDGQGDYLLPKGLSAEEYKSREVIYTEGDITSITASWQFSGQVTLKVSADNGDTYASVINGVPLTTDFFKTGRGLKWKADVGPASELIEVKISYTDKTGVGATFGSQQLSGFKYRKKIQINHNPLYESLFNYQMELKVGESRRTKGADFHCEGNILADFADVRFVCLDEETILPHYIEKIEGTKPNRLAVAWVKIPQISPAGIEIYIYYGNPDAQDLSCGEEVFDFFDDFSSAQLDTEKWEIKRGKDGSYAVLDSQLELDDATVVSKTYELRDGIVEYSAALKRGRKIEFIVRGEDTFDESKDRSLIAYSSVYEKAEHCIVVGDNIKVNDKRPISTDTKYNYRVIADGPNLTFARYSDAFDKKQAEVSFSDVFGIEQGYVGLRSTIGTGHNKACYDWVRVRRYAPSEPQVLKDTKAQKQEEVEMPQFINTVIDLKGDVVLDDKSREGLYIPVKIRAMFDVRILITDWKGTNVSLDVSADDGVNFKKSCVNGAYYYASLGDFVPGKNILANVYLSPDRRDPQASRLEELTLSGSPGIISMIVPNGGELWQKGIEKEIMWSALDYEDSYDIKLEYSLDNGQSFNTIVEKTKNTGQFLWQVPLDILSSSEVKMKVSDANDTSVYDSSDNVFEIMDSKEAAEKEKMKKEEGVVSWTTWMISQGKAIPNINTKVVISGDVILSTDSDIRFKTLIIGDGKSKSKLILNNNIDAASTDIIIRKGGELIQANNNLQTIRGDLVVEDAGILTHKFNDESQSYQVSFCAQNIIIKKGAIVSADKKGYAGGTIRSDGKGKSAGQYIKRGAVGGSHGGVGGSTQIRKLTKAKADSLVYGVKRQPQESGSGGAGSWFASGGAGGGVIRLDAREEFSISSRISANGEDGDVSLDNQFDGAGGAGGSVYLTAGVFSGEGAQIIAQGGSGHISGGGGGGGRVYLKAPAGLIKGTLNANGGEGFEKGKAGSLIVE
ncbi:MAG: DUF2341 domain-containing protein [Candidatus Omnitrophota bacterium]|nr:MAG: DUF2341 domain-containing protein [Candidatus Omnitrophota bacterium]